MAAGDLCDYADVTTYLPGYSANTDTDEKIVKLITAESEQFAADSHAEFVPTEETQPAARLFEIDARGRVYVGALDGGETLSVELINSDGTTTAVASGDVATFYGPRRNPTAAWQPVTELELQGAVPRHARREQLVQVTATWGFPEVPTFVTEAVAASVILRYVSDVASAGTALADALDSINIRGLVARREDALATLAQLQPPFVG
jgi:hypothetical protein